MTRPTQYQSYIVLDFEATCVDAADPEPGFNPHKREIIEFPMVVLSATAPADAPAAAAAAAAAAALPGPPPPAAAAAAAAPAARRRAGAGAAAKPAARRHAGAGAAAAAAAPAAGSGGGGAPEVAHVVAEFQSYARPVVNPRLTRFCTQLTGITQATVDAAPAFKHVLWRAQEFLEEQGLAQQLRNQEAVFVTCGDWDLGTGLRKQCELSGTKVPNYMQRWLNIKAEYALHYGRPARGMVEMLEELGIPLEGRHHSGIDDTRNTARVLTRMLRDGWAPAPQLLRVPESQ
ncbi:MAG: ribonuclease H-like domain-containing protein [Monoraphidium minutum]|nr:MAG: ribonuclease H-like domain-containing protein [Monoraphidium minutum]